MDQRVDSSVNTGETTRGKKKEKEKRMNLVFIITTTTTLTSNCDEGKVSSVD